MSNQETLFCTIKYSYKKRHEDPMLWKAKVADYKIEQGKPEASIVAEIE